MIARVRIAPYEHWCIAVKKFDPEVDGKPNEVGMEIEIHTDKIRQNMDVECGGKEWQLTDASVDALVARTGAQEPIRPCYICEHMLEMD